MKFTKHQIIVLLLVLLLMGSTFIGIPLNGGDKGWLYINGIFRDFVAGNPIQNYSFLHVLVLLSTIVLYLMPLFIVSAYRNKIIIVVPAMYLVLTILTFPLFIFLCIPFILCWILLISVATRRTMQ